MSSDLNNEDFDFNDFIFENAIPTERLSIRSATTEAKEQRTRAFIRERLGTNNVALPRVRMIQLDFSNRFPIQKPLGPDELIEQVCGKGAKKLGNGMYLLPQLSPPKITSERRNSQNLHSKFDPTYDGGELKVRNLPKATPGDFDYYNWMNHLVRVSHDWSSVVVL